MDHDHEPIGGVLGWLDGPRLVVGAFAFFLLGLAVLGILLWSDQRQQQKVLAAQVARIDDLASENRTRARAASEEAVSRCFSSATQSPALRKVLLAIELETMDVEAKAALRTFRRLSEENSSTLPECRALAKRLHVPVPKEFAQ